MCESQCGGHTQGYSEWEEFGGYTFSNVHTTRAAELIYHHDVMEEAEHYSFDIMNRVWLAAFLQANFEEFVPENDRNGVDLAAVQWMEIADHAIWRIEECGFLGEEQLEK